MALQLQDRVLETANSPGTGTVTLLGASLGYQSFNTALTSGSTTYYTIADLGGANWEVGVGTFTSPSTLTRDTILSSSNSGSAVNFSTGIQNVFIAYPAEKSVNLDGSGNVSPLGTVASGTWQGTAVGIGYGGTGQTTASAAFNALSPVTTTGDLIIGNGSNSATRLAIGTDGYVLTSNGTTASWEIPDFGGGTVTTTDFTATAGQTVFTVNYTVGSTEVYQNGVKLGIADFTATNGTSITLATGATVGDLVEVVTFSVLNLYSTITYEDFSGNGATTVFTMSAVPANSASLLVAISGVVQDPGTYTVSSTTLTFLTAPPSGTNNISVRYLGIASVGTVGSFSGGTTGLTPASATTGAVVLGGTLNVANGGTGATTASTALSNLGGLSSTNPSYTGTLTGGTGVVNLGSGQFYKDSSGNVGIGTSSPTTGLVVSNGGVAIQGNSFPTTGAGWELYSDGSTLGSFLQSYNRTGGAWLNANYNALTHIYSTNGSERMRIDSSGSLLVKTTTASIGNLVVRDTTANFGTGLSVENTAGGSRWEFVYGGDNNFYIGYNGSQRGVFNNSTGAYTATSDKTLKKNIVPISYGLKEVSNLLPSEYLMNDDAETDVNHLGFIAQDVRNVIPNAVKEMKNGVLGLEMTAFIPVLVRAIQELKAELDTVKAELAALKGTK